MKWLSLLVLILLLGGCGISPGSSTPSPTPAALQHAYFQTQQGPIQFDLSGDWKAGLSSPEMHWSSRQHGHLTVRAFSRWPHEELLKQLRSAEEKALSKPQDASEALTRPIQQMMRIPHWEPLAKELDKAWTQLRKGEGKPALASLQKVRQSLEKEKETRDFPTVLKWRFECEDLGRHPESPPQPIPVGSQKDPALLVVLNNGQSLGHGFYFARGQEIIGFELFAEPKERPKSPAVLTEMASTLILEGVQVDPAQLAAASPTPASLPTTRPGRHREERHRSGTSAWMRGLFTLLPWAIFLGFTALPAYLGATWGYQAAEMGGANVRSGAAQGAMQATFFGFGVGLGGACLCLLLGGLMLPTGSGIMSPFMAGTFLSILLVLFGLVAAVAAALMAATGAYLGASTGRRTAGLCAAVGALLGTILGPLLLASMPTRRSRSYSSLPIPVPVVQGRCVLSAPGTSPVA